MTTLYINSSARAIIPRGTPPSPGIGNGRIPFNFHYIKIICKFNQQKKNKSMLVFSRKIQKQKHKKHRNLWDLRKTDLGLRCCCRFSDRGPRVVELRQPRVSLQLLAQMNGHESETLVHKNSIITAQPICKLISESRKKRTRTRKTNRRGKVREYRTKREQKKYENPII